jgi:hypothetical protein
VLADETAFVDELGDKLAERPRQAVAGVEEDLVKGGGERVEFEDALNQRGRLGRPVGRELVLVADEDGFAETVANLPKGGQEGRPDDLRGLVGDDHRDRVRLEEAIELVGREGGEGAEEDAGAAEELLERGRRGAWLDLVAPDEFGLQSRRVVVRMPPDKVYSQASASASGELWATHIRLR